MQMKRFHKILAIILAVTLSTAIIAGIATAAVGSSYVYNAYQSAEHNYVDFDTKTITDSYTSVEIKETTYNIDVITTTAKETKITYPTKYIDVSVSNNKLTIRENSKNKWGWFNFPENWLSGNDQTIIIEVPETLESLEVGSNVGNVNITSLKLKSLRLNGGVGNTVVKNSDISDSIKIDAGVGNVNLNNITGSSKIDVNGGVGNTNFNELKANQINIDAGVGNIDLVKINVQELDVNAGVGDVEIKASTIKTLTGSNGLGKIRISSDTTIENNRLYFES